MSVVTKVKLNNNLNIPILGLGTWKSQKNQVKQAVIDAVHAGYRHIDGAFIYQNEDEVGEAVRELISKGVVKREELFITSKLWNTFHKKENVPKAIALTLKSLGLDYIDLYLIHWPIAFQEGDDLFPKDASGANICPDVDFVETWQAMEELVHKGLTRSIGVSNFNAQQIERILNVAKIKPVINQVECHPYLSQQELLEFCKSHGIVLTAYSPLGSPDRPWAKPDDPSVLTDPVIKAIGEKYGKSPAQVCIRYQIQRGVVVIPKSVSKSRIEENAKVFDFDLCDGDMQDLRNLNKNYRAVTVPWMKSSKYYPF